jgi:dTDP-4-amino-4,6-dideoxygalactose transaminase
VTEPFLPFTRPSIDEETVRAVGEVLRSGWLASGPKVLELEQALSDYVGGRPVRVMTSATAGLEIALHVAGIGAGDEVITPAMSFVATANVIVRVGARPVFVDVELGSRNIDLAATENAITPRTKAIMPVHFAGHALDMEWLYDIAKRHRLRVIEDAAHAIGTTQGAHRIGSIGDLVCFSFHPNKNMTTIEGGALVGNDAAEMTLIERHRFHGLVRDTEGGMDVFLPGGKANLADVAAQIGLGQLRRLEQFNEQRRALVARYFEKLSAEPEMQLPSRSDGGHSWHIFAPLLPLEQLRITRGDFIRLMHARGIGVGVHYPAIHLFTYYRTLGHKEGDFPIAERIGRETVTLPLFPAMREADVDRVCGAISEIFAEYRR